MSGGTIHAWLCPDLLFDGQSLLPGQAVGISDTAAVAVVPVSSLPTGARCLPVRGTLTPGFLDLQVNGGGDVFLNTDPTPGGIATIAAAHRRFGTVGIMPSARCRYTITWMPTSRC